MSGLLTPLSGGTLTQYFNCVALSLEYSYYHIGTETAMFGYYNGSTWCRHFHAGVDWAAAYGTPVRAMEAGVVKYAGWAAYGSGFSGGGIVVIVHIDGGMQYVVCHLAYASVKSGQRVIRGQKLGAEGSTGFATGAHVHTALFTTLASGAIVLRNALHYITGGKYAGSALIRPFGLPDTGTESDLNIATVDCVASYSPAAQLHIAAGETVSGYKPDVLKAIKTVKFATASGMHASRKVLISQSPTTSRIPHGYFWKVVDGIFAGLYVPTTQASKV